MDFVLAYGYIFIVGVIMGSFFNVVGLRIPINESIIMPPSACPTCKHRLTPLELIPIISYMVQKGKCKQCRHKISAIYPLMEFITGVLFCFTFFRFGWRGETMIGLALISLFMIILVSDVKYMIIPDQVLAFFAILFVIGRLFIPIEPWWDTFAGAIVGFGLLYLIAVISNGGMGGGDIKLFALIGLVLGVKGVLIAFFASCLVGSVIGIGLRITGKAKKGQLIPFGPFIVIGTLSVYFFGELYLNLYLQLF